MESLYLGFRWEKGRGRGCSRQKEFAVSVLVTGLGVSWLNGFSVGADTNVYESNKNILVWLREEVEWKTWFQSVEIGLDYPILDRLRK